MNSPLNILKSVFTLLLVYYNTLYINFRRNSYKEKFFDVFISISQKSLASFCLVGVLDNIKVFVPLMFYLPLIQATHQLRKI